MLDKTFSPAAVEGRIYAEWEASGAFRAGRRPGADAGAEPFCIVIPPPNVTGRLHIGHALNNTLQDALTRFERMRGKDVLWQPGMDHAGIATQLVVERQLAEKQQSRRDMTREQFVEKVWEWKAESGGAITQQLRRLGASCDWSRERFTMDEGLSRAVLKVFVELHKQGLIYKDKRLVNWDPRLQTAVSDLEVESIELKGHLWHLKYPIENEPGRFIVVATTRPETMLGDTAVAVHPDDERYKDLVGKRVILPLASRPIPIIADEHSDPEKGTGAVKITPGHDFNDFEVGKRHNLPILNILNKDATLNDSVPQAYRGLDRFKAREQILADLEALELVDKIEPITHAVPHDEKTKTVVLEPYLTEQWYFDVKPLAEKALKAVEDGRTRFVPENWTNVYFHWLKNIQPWCISRQLWWGHQIPVWYGLKMDENRHIDFAGPSSVRALSSESFEAFVAETEEDALKAAEEYYGRPVEIGEDGFRTDAQRGGLVFQIFRDEDVLDTWFSSALWPFSTLGWPDETPELKRYYPTSVLITGFDIIFFWVARMMMMGLHFMDEVPFHTVFIHTRVLDEKGVKMSKTKGNVVDPLDLIDQYGADALRFTLALAAGQGRDMRIGPSRVEVNRNFATKLWNAARFCEMNECVTKADFDPATVSLTLNKWIVGETRAAAADVTGALEALRFNEAAGAAYHFVWDVFCDWYLEFAKPVFNGSDEAAKAETRAAAAWVRDQILTLLHPFMPFITEELWARTAEHAGPREHLLIQSAWPSLWSLPEDKAAHDEMQWVIDLVSGIRSIRSEMNVPPSAKIQLVLKDANAETARRLQTHRDVIATLARLADARTDGALPQGSAQFVIGEAVAALPLGDVIDFAKERARLEKELKKANDEIARFDAKLANEQFVSRAPEEVLAEQREKRADAAALAARLSEAIKHLG
ncbi:MAG: valine--tRNA ligase [Alphaproteobacteria bacterium]|nr:valine--tRNA ligase [Alphaproteobacteria bacterium]MDE2011763.1 valine--tRNA ligase [Alphaproteobacteria bacterium]MDE2074895.1 valine--tRNA ligase [Alphaproteobacteria bacterium]